jgi:phosphate starvation-inducible PhoH-like protein
MSETEPRGKRKGEIKAINAVQLDDFQKEAVRMIMENQIVIISGPAGSGKSLVCASAALKLLKNKEVKTILNTRAAIEVGKSLGYLPGELQSKFDPYMEAFVENLNKCCISKDEIPNLVKSEQIKAMPVQFIRGKTVDDILIVEESQNLTKAEMLAILTRLGKNGRIVINGDNEQKDIKDEFNGLSYAIELSKHVDGIAYTKLQGQHRSDLVSKILAYEHQKNNLK